MVQLRLSPLYRNTSKYKLYVYWLTLETHFGDFSKQIMTGPHITTVHA